MNRILGAIGITIAVCFYSSGMVYGAPSEDALGGNNILECKGMLEEKEQECQEKLQEKDRQCQDKLNQTTGSPEAVEEMRSKNATLMETYEKLKLDYENVMGQVTRLRRENKQFEEIRMSYEEMEQDAGALLEKNQAMEQGAQKRTTIIENLKEHLKELAAQKDQLAILLVEAQDSEDVKIKRIRQGVKDKMADLKKQVAILQQENGSITKTLEKREKELSAAQSDNSGLNQKIGVLQDEMRASEEQYDALKKENKYLAQEATQFPRKFADLARHNRKLVKETADMHYNLGVANIKNKEYGRAIKEFQKVLELKPQDAYANYNLGYIYAEHVVDREKAIQYFKNYLAYAPDAKDADWVRKYVLTWQTWYGKNRKK